MKATLIRHSHISAYRKYVSRKGVGHDYPEVIENDHLNWYGFVVDHCRFDSTRYCWRHYFLIYDAVISIDEKNYREDLWKLKIEMLNDILYLLRHNLFKGLATMAESYKETFKDDWRETLMLAANDGLLEVSDDAYYIYKGAIEKRA